MAHPTKSAVITIEDGVFRSDDAGLTKCVWHTIIV